MTTIEAMVADAKAMLRLEGGAEDALLARLAAAALGLCAAFLRRDVAADWAAVPAPIAHGLVLMTAHLWENRGREDAPPAAVTALWRPFRVMGIGA